MNYARIALAGIAAWLASIVARISHQRHLAAASVSGERLGVQASGGYRALLPIGLGAQLVACLAFAFAYAKGYEGDGSHIGEGMRFGLIVALMIDGFAVVWNYVTQPIAPRLGVLADRSRIVGQLGVYGAIVGLDLRAERPRDSVVTDRRTRPKGGLEDVVATSSAICYLDGDRGVLAYCGYDIHDLARSATFEEVCYLLWHRRLPTRAELGDLQSQLAAARALPEADHPPDAHRCRRSTAWTRCARSRRRSRHYDAEADDASPQAQYRKAVRLTAQTGTVVATWGRLQAGGGPIAPDPVDVGTPRTSSTCSPASGRTPTAIRAFDVALILHADHELNASTFAARVAAATLTDIYSAVVGGIGALKGPLHGGANAEVMKMLLEFGQNASARARGRGDSREVRAQGEDPRLRPPRLPHRGSARDAPAPDVARARQARRQHRLVRHVAAHRGAGEGREEAESERRLLLGVDLLHARHPDRSLHADLRRQPHVGMDRARPRAVREQPADSPARRLHRAPTIRSASFRSSSDEARGCVVSWFSVRACQPPELLEARRWDLASSSGTLYFTDRTRMDRATFAISPSSRTSTMASRRWPIASSS